MFYKILYTYITLLFINYLGFVYIYFNGKLKSNIVRTIWIYLLLVLLTEITSLVMSRNGVNNLFLSHAFFIFQTLILANLFIKHFLNRIQIKVARIYLGFSLTFIFIQYIIFPSLLFEFNLFEIFLMNFFLIVCSLFYFYNTLGSERRYKFLIFGILFYNILSTSVFLLANIATQINIDIANSIWLLNLFLLITYQLLIIRQWFSLKMINVNGKRKI